MLCHIIVSQSYDTEVQVGGGGGETVGLCSMLEDETNEVFMTTIQQPKPT